MVMIEDGYYLFVYTNISSLGYLYNIGVRDNQNMSLWKKVENNLQLIHYWEFERISGIKQHNKSFYSKAHAERVINHLLGQYGLTLHNMNKIIGTPGLGNDDDNTHQLNRNPSWNYHSLSHIYSGLMMDSEIFASSNILALNVDGGPDNVMDTLGRSKPFYIGATSSKGQLSFFQIQSPGILWAFMKHRYKMQEGALMALGSAVDCHYYYNEDELFLSLPPIGYMKDINAVYRWFDNLAQQIELIDEANTINYCTGLDRRFSVWENKVGMLVQIIQQVSIRLMDCNVQQLLDRSGFDPHDTYLSITGGYGLNCPTNSYLMNKYQFIDLLSPPCVSDTGISLGMAMYYFTEHGIPQFKLCDAYYGNDAKDLNTIIASGHYSQYVKSISPMKNDEIALDIQNHPIVWFDGRSEIGPRALGHRSIFADPTNPEHKNYVNLIKQRQWWRPVAPIVLEESLDDWFECSRTSPFMLQNFYAKPEVRSMIPAVLHLDYTARIQTVSKNSTIGRIVSAFQDKTGIPIICNTSLNDHGEPIIDTIPQVFNFALRKRIPIIYINHTRIVLQNHNLYTCGKPAERESFFYFDEIDTNRDALIESLNPEHLSREQLVIYLNNPALTTYSLTEAKDVRYLKKLLHHMKSLPG